MKVSRRGNVLKLKHNDYMDEPSVVDYWEMCMELYEKATYVNDVALIINPGSDRETYLEKRFDLSRPEYQD